MSRLPAPALVLFIVRPAEGGMRRHVLDLLAGLDRARFRPVVAGPPEGDWQVRLAAMGIAYHCLPISASLSPLNDLRAAGRLRLLLSDLKPDLVHCHGGKAALVARLAMRRRGGPACPLLYTVHGASAPGRAWQAALAALAERRLAPRTAGYIAVSRAVAGDVAHRWGIPADRLTVIHNGIATGRFSDLPGRSAAKRALGLEPRRPLVGMIARAVWEKGPDVFVRAAALVVRRRPGCRFLLAGAGPALAETRRLAHALGVADAILFTGFHRDVPRLLAALDVFVQPSRSEGLGIGVMEAMAAGRAVVASRVGGIPEVVRHRGSGLLVPPGDPESLGEAVLTLLDDDVLRQRLAAAGRRQARRDFDLDGAVRATEAVYGRLLGRTPDAPGRPSGRTAVRRE